MDSTSPFSKQNVNIQSVKPNSCFWTNGKMGVTFSSSLRSFCPTAVRAIDNGGFNTRNQKINFSGISSSPPEAPKLLEILEDVFFQPRKVFFCIKGRLPFPKGIFLKRGCCEICNAAVSVTLSPQQAASFLCHRLHRGLVQAEVDDICIQPS